MGAALAPQSGPDHDYQAEWDYDVVEPSDIARKTLAAVEPAIRAEILPALGIAGMTITFVHGLGGDLARYCSGTASWPVIVIDFEAHLAGCRNFNLSIPQQLKATIVHELAHAYQEAMGIEEHDDETEDQAEAFARDYVVRANIDLDLLSPERAKASDLVAEVNEGPGKTLRIHRNGESYSAVRLNNGSITTPQDHLSAEEMIRYLAHLLHAAHYSPSGR